MGNKIGESLVSDLLLILQHAPKLIDVSLLSSFNNFQVNDQILNVCS